MTIIKTIRRVALAVLAAAGGLLLTGPAPAQAAVPSAAGSCSTNYYDVSYAPSGVYESPGSGWLKNKGFNEPVQGPNSNVMDNYVNGCG